VRRLLHARWGAVLLVGLVLGPLPHDGPGPASASAGMPPISTSAADTTAPADPELLITSVSPVALGPDGDLAVTARLRAGSQEAVPAGSSVELRLQRSQLSTRSDVAAWTAQDDAGAVGSRLAVLEVPEAIEPGGSLEVSLSVPAAEAGLPAANESWGPRGVSVVLRDGDSARLAVARTHVVWYPGRAFDAPTMVTVVVPVTGGAPDPGTGLLDPAALAAQTQDGGRLDAALLAASTPGAVLALDPAVLEHGPPGDQGGAEPPAGSDEEDTAASSQHERWVSRVRTVAAAQESLMLGYGDPDNAALAHAGETAIARLSEERARDAVQRLLDAPVRTDIGWPVGSDADTVTVNLLAELGRSAVILDESAQPLARIPSASSDGRSVITDASSPTPTLLADTALTSTLAAVGQDGPDGGVAAIQTLLADSAAITLQRPSRSRHVLVTAPRSWSVDPRLAGQAVAALLQAPWNTPAGLQPLLDAAPVARPSPELTVRERASELAVPGLQQVGASLSRAERLSAAFADPAGIVLPAQRSAVALASSHWRGSPQQWRQGVAAFEQRTQDRQNSVRVVPGSTVTQVSRNVRLPVTVQNDSDQPVTVVLDVTPRSSRLVVTGTVTLVVPANDREIGYVPVRGVGNGDTSVRIQLLTQAGAPLGQPVQTEVLVRADWESWGTYAVAAVAALVLAVGLFRTVRRGKVRRGHDPLQRDAVETGATTNARSSQ